MNALLTGWFNLIKLIQLLASLFPFVCTVWSMLLIKF